MLVLLANFSSGDSPAPPLSGVADVVGCLVRSSVAGVLSAAHFKGKRNYIPVSQSVQTLLAFSCPVLLKFTQENNIHALKYPQSFVQS